MHSQPLPTFDQARSMLLLEEERLGKGKKTWLNKDESSSSAKVLNVTPSQPEQKSNNSNFQQRNFQNRENSARNRGRGRSTNNQQRQFFNQWSAPYWQTGYPMWPQQQFNPLMQLPQQSHPQQGLLGPRPQQQLLVQGPHNNAVNQQIPTTDFASAFNTMTLVDPTDGQWYMDSGATAHLTNAAGNLQVSCLVDPSFFSQDIEVDAKFFLVIFSFTCSRTSAVC
ncbi:uncharacterized protein LOC103857690 [Brassica rapa]|nr:uncharacterized protein LOC103857690 [Brassica rapa]